MLTLVKRFCARYCYANAGDNMTIIQKYTKFTLLSMVGAALCACGNASVDTAPEVVAEKRAEVALKTTKVDVAAIANMSPMELMEAATVQSNQLADVLAEVNDEASAQIAVAEIRALGPQLRAVGERMNKLSENDLKLSIKTMKSMQSFAEAQMRVLTETGRISEQHPELRTTMIDAFEDIEIVFK
jgi:hypothetical protein